MNTQKNHSTNSYINGTRVNCKKNRPAYKKILELIYVMAFESSKQFRKPLGYHLRIRFTDSMTASSFSARLGIYYKRKSKYTPLRVCAIENDPNDGHVHYHYAVIIDGRYDTIYSARYFLGELQKAGFIHDYHIKGHDDAKWGLPLINIENIEKYIYWLSYIAKTETKPKNRQTHSASPSIIKATRSWIKAGRPPLNIERKAANDSPQSGTLADFFANQPI